MRANLFRLLFLLIAATLASQVSGAQAVAISNTNCPVDMQASKTPQGNVARVSGGGDPAGIGVELLLRALNLRPIQQAKVTLRGIVGPQVLPAGERSRSRDIAESFTLSGGTTPKAALRSVVYSEHLTGVRWIELDRVTYTGGTSWQQSPGTICRVSPNHLLLVGAIN